MSPVHGFWYVFCGSVSTYPEVALRKWSAHRWNTK